MWAAQGGVPLNGQRRTILLKESCCGGTRGRFPWEIRAGAYQKVSRLVDFQATHNSAKNLKLVYRIYLVNVFDGIT